MKQQFQSAQHSANVRQWTDVSIPAVLSVLNWSYVAVTVQNKSEISTVLEKLTASYSTSETGNWNVEINCQWVTFYEIFFNVNFEIDTIKDQSRIRDVTNDQLNTSEWRLLAINKCRLVHRFCKHNFSLCSEKPFEILFMAPDLQWDAAILRATCDLPFVIANLLAMQSKSKKRQFIRRLLLSWNSQNSCRFMACFTFLVNFTVH